MRLPAFIADPAPVIRLLELLKNDDEEYVRVDGRWMFKSKKSTNVFSTPFDAGWAKVRSA